MQKKIHFHYNFDTMPQLIKIIQITSAYNYLNAATLLAISAAMLKVVPGVYQEEQNNAPDHSLE